MFEYRLIDSFQYGAHNFLYEFIAACRYTERPGLAVCFWDVGSSYRFGVITVFLDELYEIQNSVFGESVHGDVIYSSGYSAFVGVQPGIGFLPEKRVFQQSEQPIYTLALLGKSS